MARCGGLGPASLDHCCRAAGIHHCAGSAILGQQHPVGSGCIPVPLDLGAAALLAVAAALIEAHGTDIGVGDDDAEPRPLLAGGNAVGNAEQRTAVTLAA